MREPGTAERPTELCGRQAEQRAIAALLADAAAGRSGALVLRGEPGIGKTALLDHAATAADGLRLLRGTGIEVEAELPFAGLQLLLRPALGRLAALPAPQRTALEAALGLEPAAARDPMLIGLAVLSLLAEHAADTGLLCLVDDAQWLDGTSRDALVFAARRLHAEGVALVFAIREGEGSFPDSVDSGLPELRLTGLPPEVAAVLVDRQPLAPAVRYRLLAEARGNPLALLELPVALAAEPDSGLGPHALPLTDRLLLAFHGQVRRLPETTRGLLLVAAADETGDPAVILGAAAAFGAGIGDLTRAEETGLLRRPGAAATTVVFRHPLIRAAVYQRAPLGRRLTAHRALAAVLDAPEQADRRAWHLAAAATGPDDEAAAALEHTAARARERGGHEAAAAAYERAARLSAAPAARARRELLAAEAALEAGEVERADRLARRAARHADPADGLGARLAQVRALAEFWRGSFPTAQQLLVEGAELVTDTDPGQAAALLVQAVHTAWYLGEGRLAETLERLAAVPLPDADPSTPLAAFLGHLLDHGGDGPPPPALADTMAAIRRRGRAPEQSLMILCGAALGRGQDADAYRLATALATELRGAGAAGRLPTALFFVAEGEVFTGRLQDALTTATEALALARDTGQRQWVGQFSSVLAHLAAAEGDEAACRRHAEAGLASATAGAIAPGAPWAHWSLGLLELGLGRPEAALSHFERLTREPMRHHLCALRSVPDLVEAAVRVGAGERAEEAVARFARWAESVRQPWADALLLRCRALLGSDEAAERHYPAALRAHDRDGRPLEYARTTLLHGEWLRRARRKAEARPHLDDALEVFERLGMRPWADRARAELTATGTGTGTGTGTKDAAPSRTAGLTPQELQIVRLAARGLSNRDIAAQLFLSHRTVGYHLYKAYPKLGIASRGELRALTARQEL
ncbi:helix-turn-helix transcriptional regulator [Streptomyces sp. 8K308]|uniref:AAA family ATPase n=1 Tax=Streptomyces sp. 8K308 TaxID=2530388 RepID=UPI00104606A5|nr:LuxR family transcriptional regulator [Streptomyces sp. 8K308]TDC22468.1 helix-turn-helix transcriptional regulator [Streptomyces sp. 8K308]